MVSTTKEELLYLADQQAYARSRYHEDDADLIRESLVIEQALRLSAQQREPGVRVRRSWEWRLSTGDAGDPVVKGAWWASTTCGLYIARENTIDGSGWFILEESKWNRAQSLAEAKSAAQADYEQRIRSAIEITRSDHTSKSTAARTDAGKTGVTAGETATTSDGGSPGPSPLAVEQTSSDPASGRSQPSPDVSVDELADFIGQLDILSIFVNSDDETAEIARALLSRFRIERLDRLASNERSAS